MADLVRRVTIGRGLDPRDFVLLAIGGAGPLHVGAYGRDVGARAVIVPDHASEFSALGIATQEDLKRLERKLTKAASSAKTASKKATAAKKASPSSTAAGA